MKIKGTIKGKVPAGRYGVERPFSLEVDLEIDDPRVFQVFVPAVTHPIPSGTITPIPSAGYPNTTGGYVPPIIPIQRDSDATGFKG